MCGSAYVKLFHQVYNDKSLFAANYTQVKVATPKLNDNITQSNQHTTIQ